MSYGFEKLRPSDRAPNLWIGERVEIDDSAIIGPNVVLHDDVVVGKNALIKNNTSIGVTRTYSAGSRNELVTNGVTTIGEGAAVCNNAVVFAGVTLAPGSMLGDLTLIGAHVKLGEESVVGGGAQIGMSVDIGPRVRIQNATHLTPETIVEEDVFVGPGVHLTNNNTPGRAEAQEDWRITLRRGCRIGAGAILTPGVEIGEEAFIAAGAVITKDVGPREKIRGVPGRVYGTVADEDLLENWR